MKSLLVLLLLFMAPAFYFVKQVNEKPIVQAIPRSGTYQLYTEMHLNNVIDYAIFKRAMEGYKKIEEKKKELITLIDFTKPSTEERLYVLDMKEKKLLYSSLVSHGKNSGGLYATSFSNRYGSYQSSLGFYLTENTYIGKNGYSLILEGLEKGINDRARERAIVVHGAPYSNPSVISSSGRLGRSLGCPALPQTISKEIINTIKDGSLLFIYANDEKYLSKSDILNKKEFV
ncbi:MAG: murein L,D-transpeptidase catalytic domain family protein [Bacteroides sp.]|nr:murein L,D-transpeptidase catalytic domain family protein [Bacteroides sp.]